MGRRVPPGGGERPCRVPTRLPRCGAAARAGVPARAADLALRPALDELAAAPFPKLVVSGGHSDGFDAICDDLAERIGSARSVVRGAGHEIQFTGEPINDRLRALWCGTSKA